MSDLLPEEKEQRRGTLLGIKADLEWGALLKKANRGIDESDGVLLRLHDRNHRAMRKGSRLKGRSAGHKQKDLVAKPARERGKEDERRGKSNGSN